MNIMKLVVSTKKSGRPFGLEETQETHVRDSQMRFMDFHGPGTVTLFASVPRMTQ